MIISFLLDGLISYYFDIMPFFTLTMLTFKTFETKNIVKISIIFGFLYDIVYTNTLFLNAFLFFLLTNLILYLNKNKKTNSLSILIYNTLIITIYVLINYFLLIIFRYISFNLLYLLSKLILSIIINDIYLFMVYFIRKKHNI